MSLIGDLTAQVEPFKQVLALMSLIQRLKFTFRQWKIHRRGLEVVIRGSCHMCGSCCRCICLYVDGRWIKTKRQIKKMYDSKPELRRFKPTGTRIDGLLEFYCEKLNEDGSCSDYENRPDLCRDYPTRDIFLQYGVLPDSCGYRMGTEQDFEKVLNNAIRGKNNKKIIKDNRRTFDDESDNRH